MTDIKPENRGFYRATVFMRTLQGKGLQHVVISPGSRSTPLVLAAAAHPHLEKHIILDERSAAFTALGIGKATNHPAALICTSGTAVANYYPAVIEARMSGIPLLLLTADRPAHLLHAGANQTINQQHIFGDYPVFFRNVGESELHSERIDDLEKLAGKAYHYSRSRQGPVHLNFPFRKPLEPREDFIESLINENKNLSKEALTGFENDQTQDLQLGDDLSKVIQAAKQPLIIAGQLSPGTSLTPIFELAQKLEAPVLSEQGNINKDYTIEGFEGFLRNRETREALEPDLIFRFGRQPAGKSLLLAIKKWNTRRHIHFSDTEWKSNISGTTSDFLEWGGGSIHIDSFTKKAEPWLKKWKDTERQYFDNSDQLFAKQNALTDGHVYRHLMPKIPESCPVFISNSFPARDQSMFSPVKPKTIYTNRGVSGIDGITSTASGVTIGLNQPGILFTGDLAFLHDTNALLNKKELSQPLVVVVINNKGGAVFRMLPISKHSNYFNTYFETPQEGDITSLTQSYGITAEKVETVGQLKQIDLKLIIAESESGMHIIECKTDPDASMSLRNKLWTTAL